MEKKAQAWYIDLVAGMLIFIIGLVVYSNANTNISNDDKEGYDDLLREADSVAAMLMTPGYPSDWNASTVEQIGVVSGHRVDAGKWSNLSLIPYNRSRELFGTGYDLFIFIQERNGSAANISSVCGIGSPVVSQATQGCSPPAMQGIAYGDLVRKERYALHGGRIVKIVVYVWG